jgi:hypothetical protein
MFMVSDAQAEEIRAAYDRGGELLAAVEVRRLFPGIADNANALACARTIANWTQPPSSEADREVEALYREGVRVRDIAKRLNRPLGAVATAIGRLQAAGVLPRRLRSYRL